MSAALRLTLTAALLSLFGLAGGLLSAPDSMAATPPVIEEASVLEASATGATLQATINPEGSETDYRFEYGPSEAYGSSAPVPDGLLGSGSSPLTVSAHVQGLSASTAYHYRVVATVASREEAIDGADGTFTTQPPGGSFVLPDGRQWELVSPPNKHGAVIEPIGFYGAIQAAENGDAMTYMTNGTIELEPAGYANAGQVFSQRGPHGWSSKDIATPHNSRASTGGSAFEYQLFSADLSLGLVNPDAPFTPLSAGETERSPNLRHDFTCESSPSTCYTSLVNREDVAPGLKWDVNFPEGSPSVEIAGATPDLSHVILSDENGLTETSSHNGNLYEWSAGHLQLVSIKPVAEGGAAASSPGLGSVEGGPSHEIGAISNDGSRIFWHAETGEGQTLYMRDTQSQETLKIGSGEVVFQAASSEGSRVFFSTDSNGDEVQELDVCDVVSAAGKLSCDMTKLAPEMLSSVLGISKDGSWAYFVSDAKLANGAVAGHCLGAYWYFLQAPGAMCNLYALHYNGTTWESPKLIAVLSGEDHSDWQNGPAYRPTSVSADGKWLAFMSQRGLTGYDNRDAFGGKPDEEVYLYDSQTEKLSCVSCDPTGARPVGQEANRESKGSPELSFSTWNEGTWLAATIPGWTNTQAPGSALYQSRYLSESGRLFFNSRDALVPQDVNGEWDVYEYEPEGIGGCQSSSATFSVRTGGCVSLISSGTSPQPSGFMDASASGDDVFFLTTSQLTSEDFDSAYDIYDAHACSAAEPCVPAPTSPPPCSTEASCRPAPTPQPASFGAPASQTFSGIGNPPGPVHPSTTPHPRALTRAQMLAGALRVCRRERRAGRGKCERTARRKFAVKQSRGVATKSGRGSR
jgi:hypothetical protein